MRDLINSFCDNIHFVIGVVQVVHKSAILLEKLLIAMQRLLPMNQLATPLILLANNFGKLMFSLHAMLRLSTVRDSKHFTDLCLFVDIICGICNVIQVMRGHDSELVAIDYVEMLASTVTAFTILYKSVINWSKSIEKSTIEYVENCVAAVKYILIGVNALNDIANANDNETAVHVVITSINDNPDNNKMKSKSG